jgi:hypothetical protein
VPPYQFQLVESCAIDRRPSILTLRHSTDNPDVIGDLHDLGQCNVRPLFFDDAVMKDKQGQFQTIIDPEFVKYVRKVMFDRLLADGKQARDFLV